MTKIRTRQAFGNIFNGQLDHYATARKRDDQQEPVVIVSGATESEVLAAFAALERSREECEWHRCPCDEAEYETWNHNGMVICGEAPNFCPSCGRKVKVVE